MKITTSDVTIGTILDLDGGLFKVIDMGHTHTWRWGATDSFKVKEIITGKVKNVTYTAWANLEKAEVQTNNAVFLYKAGDMYSFMENDTGEMFDIEEATIDDITPYLKENLDCYIMKHNGDILSVILPATIEYTIESTVDGIKWDRSKAGTKPATLSNGMEVQVPLHKDVWQIVTINTQTGKVS